MIWRVAGVALLVALGAAAIVVAAGGDERGPALSADTRSAGALVDSIGVNVHFGYGDTAYANQALVLTRLNELGVRHFRDATAGENPLLAAGLKAAAGQGLRGTLIADPRGDPAGQVSGSLLAMGRAVEAFEGPNEVDDGRDPAWAPRLQGFMPAFESAVGEAAPEATLVGPSFIDSSSRTEVAPAALPGLFNSHPYAGGDPPEAALDRALRDRPPAARARAAVFTEAGYHGALLAPGYHTPVSEQAAAVYIPRLLLTAFGAGARRTFLYELVDGKPDPTLTDPQQHFGLLRNDLSPKPAFSAVRTLIGALRASPGPPTAELPSWELAEDAEAKVKQLTLRRADGSLMIALWRPVSVWDEDSRRAVDPGRLALDLSFAGREGRDVEVWRPSRSPLPVERHARVSRLSLGLEGDLVLISLR